MRKILLATLPVLLMAQAASQSGGAVTTGAGLTSTSGVVACNTATATDAGCVTTAAQTFAGGKQFNDTVVSGVTDGGIGFSVPQGTRIALNDAGTAYLYFDGTTTHIVGTQLTSDAASNGYGFLIGNGARIAVGGSHYWTGDSSGIQLSANASGTLKANAFQSGSHSSSAVFGFDSTGLHIQDTAAAVISVASTDNSGSPGATTISKIGGKAAIAASASSVVVTNTTVTTSSIILLAPLDIDATCLHWKAVPASGSFTVTMDAACTSTWKFQFLNIIGA